MRGRWQVPLPSHRAGSTRSVELAQLGTPHTVPTRCRRQAPAPLQVPSRPQDSGASAGSARGGRADRRRWGRSGPRSRPGCRPGRNRRTRIRSTGHRRIVRWCSRWRAVQAAPGGRAVPASPSASGAPASPRGRSIPASMDGRQSSGWPSPSASACAGLATAGQLSMSSGTPSPSRSAGRAGPSSTIERVSCFPSTSTAASVASHTTASPTSPWTCTRNASEACERG